MSNILLIHYYLFIMYRHYSIEKDESTLLGRTIYKYRKSDIIWISGKYFEEPKENT